MKISQEVQQILSAAEVNGNTLKLTGQLDRPTYQAVDKVLKAIGGKWNRGAGAHVFGEDVDDIIDDIIATGEYRNIKTDFQQFDTPDDLAKKVISLADIQKGEIVLEPSAGVGRIARLAAWAGGGVSCIEIDVNRYAFLKAEGLYMAVKHGDFLDLPPAASFHKVVMNPPFSRAQDISHVTHAIGFLKPGGTLVAIMSPGIKFRQGKKYDAFRSLMAAHNAEMFDVDEGAFKESGTQIRTVIVRMRKPAQ